MYRITSLPVWLWLLAPMWIQGAFHSRPKADFMPGTVTVASELYKTARQFEINALILGLEKRYTELYAKDCDSAASCLAYLQLSDTFAAFPAQTFLTFAPSQDYTERFKEKKRRFERRLKTKDYPRLNLSVLTAPLVHVLENVLQRLNIPAALSSRIQGNVSLYLKNADAMEVLFYLLHFHRLSLEKTGTGLAIRPQPGTGRFEP